MNKQELFDALLERINRELETLERAARATYEGAIHSESVAEDEYDTRGIEQSYLAGAQSARVKELRATLALLRAMPIGDFSTEDLIRPGALVELKDENGERSLVFLAVAGGGASVALEGRVVRVITPDSPLGSELVDRQAGDDFELDLPAGTRSYEIVAVT